MRLPLISRRNQMNTAQPIRNLEDLKNFKNYYKEIHPNARNQLLVILGLNTALRISDLLTLRWEDVYNFSQNRWQEHIEIIEQKTGKTSCIYINHNIHVFKIIRHSFERSKNLFSQKSIFFLTAIKMNPSVGCRLFASSKRWQLITISPA